MAIQGFFTGDVKIRDLNGVLKAVDGIVEVATDAGTVTSVGLQVGTSGTDVNVANSPVTTSGNITLNLPTASATNRGLLSSADWAIFDAKQGSITLTTTGNNGSATLTSGTLNIPTYTLAGLGGISLTSLSASSPLAYNNTTGAFSIQVANGSQNGYLSSSDWTTFNSKQSALTFSSPLVNSSGTVSIPAATSSVNGYLTSTDWATFNNKQGAITLTTTGSSGAATLIGTTLNIPNYSGALTGYVPYTGATGNVDLGEYGISSGYFQADLTPSGTLQVGRMQWNSTDGTMDLRLMGNNVTLQIGQEQVARVVNGTGGNLLEANYQAVKIIGAQGQRLQVGLARADNDANSKDTLGLVTENINNNQEGFITVSGLVNEINTTGSLQGETWADGDTLYLSGTTSGAITNVKPTAPIHTVIVGFVVYAHANHGKIFVKVDNGYELEELHDVAPTPYVNKGVLYRDTATNLWKSATIGTLLGYTPANAATTLTINGTAYDLSANRTWNVGTVTSIGTSGPLTGGTITGSGTIGITQSSAASDGYLSNTDWTTFNNKQTALNGTGFVKISGTTISYDNSTYYLASNPSAFIALTALSATAPLSYDNTTGVFSISQATTSTNGYLSSTDWNTFNNKQAAGSYITALTGEATASGPGSANVTLSTSAVTGKILTGLNLTGGGTIADTDSILQAFGKVQNQISGLAGGVTYQGVWNASTNTPTLTSSVGTKGYYYIVDVAGSTNLNGITDWKVGDWAIFNGSTWDKVDNTDAVSSVNGFTGAVSLTTSNIAEGTNLYYLDSRARLALSFTAGSGAYDNTTGVITIPTNTSQLTNGANFITLSSLSASSPLSYNSGTGALSIQVANGSQNGYLSSTDWTTFNSKQAAGNYVTTDTVQTITALKTFTSKVTLNTGGTDDQLQIVGTAPSVRLTNAVTGATINGFIAMSGANDNYIQGSVSGDMTIGNQNNGKILFGFGSGTATQKLSLDSSGNAVLAGGLTLGSTLSNGTYTYTLPGATGTLALVGGAGVGTVTSVAALTIGTSGTDLSSTVANSTTTPVITLNVPTASATNRGVLSSTDWTTFNNKQSALTNPVTGTGTTNYLPKFTGTSTIGNSIVYDNGSVVSIGTNGTLVQTLNINSTYASQSLNSTSGNFAYIGLNNGATGGAFNLAVEGSAGGTFGTGSTAYAGVLSRLGAYNLQFATNNVVRATIDASGNLGLGVTPSAWGTYKAYQVGYGSIASYNDADTAIFSNTYFDGGTWRYIGTGYASQYRQLNSVHSWHTATSGTAGNAISFTQAMTLDASGRLGIGTTSISGSYRLTLNGDSSTNTGGIIIRQSGTDVMYIGNIAGSNTTDFEFWNPRNGYTRFATNNIERMRLDASGNLGLGVTPSNAYADSRTFEIGANGILWSEASSSIYNSLIIGLNFYYNAGGTAVYKNSSIPSSRYIQYQGSHQWSTASSGTAGNAISFTQAMTLNASGNLSIGNTNDTYKLDVTGTARVTSNLLAQKVQVGTAATINDATGVGNTLQFANYSAGVFVTGSADSYIYKTSSVFGGLAAQTLIFQTRSDVSGGGFAFVGGSTPSVIAKIDQTGAATFSSSVTATGQILVSNTINAYAYQNFGANSGYGWQIGKADNSGGIAPSNGFYIYDLTNSATRFSIASSGAATFSNSITAGGDVTLSGNESYLYFTSTYLVGSNTRAKIRTVGAGGGSGYGGDLRFSTRNSSNVWNEDAMTINSSGSVGIGTSSPAYTLNVLKSVAGDYVAEINNTNTTNGYGLRVKGANGTSSYIFSANDGTNDVFIVRGDGRVGIGTTSPASKLHVYGGMTTLRAANSGQYDLIRLEDNAGSAYGAIGVNTSGFMYLSNTTGGTQHFVLNSSGNVGIGTTAPNQRFNVVTTALGGRQNMTAIDRTAQNFVTFTNPEYSVDASMGLMLRVFPQSDSRQGAGMIASGGSANGVTDLDLFVSSGSTTSTSYSALKIKGESGAIGIGTLSPAAKLHVSNNGAYGIEIDVANEIIQAYNRSTSDYNEIKFYSSNLRFFNGTSSTITERMRITSGGNVGIGTTSPDQKLVVQGDSAKIKIQTSSNPSAYYTYIESNYDSGNTFNIIDGGLYKFGAKALVTYNDTYVNSYYNIYFATGTTTNNSASNIRMFITDTGNVGIGTTSPSQKLHVIGNAIFNNSSFGSANVRLIGTGTTTGFDIIADNDNGGLWNRDNSYMYFGTNNTERMRITSGGNVGIGITNPGAKLVVSNSGGTGYEIDPQSTSGTVVSLFSYDRANALWRTTRYSGLDHRFEVNGTSEAMRITSGGNVEIATGSIKTGAPFLGTAKPWKLGAVYTGTCVPTSWGEFASWATGIVIEVEIDGSTYRIPVVVDNYC